ncbi:glycolate oxidase subunit GlcD [Pyrodictium occultum]|uniref:Glycolate oxidase subunit GlcD n=1 Tax=Pyrodictium occultum TaxID=2309 RepID=A0A0V8RVZ7_PYROC|nr:FAD-linked oxidase C-terminal domain-containing protein [Pyrodictium occultum]KSW12211.1 glycolate oxidase subunit GlcD [Pyrodictium occultum]
MSRLGDRLREILGSDKVVTDPIIIELYSREATGLNADTLPEALVFAESAADVSKLLAFAYRYGIPVYPQGSTSSLSGSALPSGGVVLSLERMRRIKEVNVVDGVAVAEPGVRIDDLNIELARYGYMFPVDPASSSVATVGGAVNTGAGGLRGAKYGTMRDWVLGLEVVLPDEEGTVMRIGCRTVKCRQGYDLVRLIVGSEGTLAVVTEATLRIAPLPEAAVTLLAFFDDLQGLLDTVVEIRSEGVQPLIMEFMERRTVEQAAGFLGWHGKLRGHMLLVSVDVNREAASRVLAWLERVARGNGAGLVYTARSLEEAEKKGLFQLRRSLFPAQVELSRRLLGSERVQVYVEDIAVPPSRLAEAVERLLELEEKYRLPMMLGGHIGDGNLHPAVGFDPGDPEARRRVWTWFHDVMRLAVELGGTVSAEHGIGVLKKEGLRMELEALGSLKALEIMKAIKRVFDPKGILNPGKVV